MIGIEFGAPTTPALKRRWRAVEATRTAMLPRPGGSSLPKAPHLTQVAADT